jgi:hypothetical protein
MPPAIHGRLPRHVSALPRRPKRARRGRSLREPLQGPREPVVGTITLLLAGARTIQYGIFPRWLGWIAVVSALGGIVTALMNLGTAAQAPPAVLDFGSFLLTCLAHRPVAHRPLVHAFITTPAESTTASAGNPAAAVASF